jgi:hypothetical protein
MIKAVRIFLLVLIIIGIAALSTYKTWVPKLVDAILRYESTVGTGIGNDPLFDTTYTIDGQPVTLKKSTDEDKVTRYFGNKAVGDLNGDGLPDIGFILTHTGGGSGTFYYAAAALKVAGGYQGTNAVFLGDRIAPQNSQIEDQQLIINYADRAPGQPMTAVPSVGVSKYLKVSGTTLTVVK